MPRPGERRPILVLGGTGEALTLSRRLAEQGLPLFYSVRGLTSAPEASFSVRSGPFGGIDGLTRFLRENRVALLVDATHPYAEIISRHAQAAAHNCALPCWALRRPPWVPKAADRWSEFGDWATLRALLAAHRRPFFTIGREPLLHLADRPETQHWLVRSLTPAPSGPGVTSLAARGPFTLEQELRLMRDFRADALVSKNSGGSAVAAKVEAAAELGLPVYVRSRPLLPVADREFENSESLFVALKRKWRLH